MQKQDKKKLSNEEPQGCSRANPRQDQELKDHDQSDFQKVIEALRGTCHYVRGGGLPQK